MAKPNTLDPGNGVALMEHRDWRAVAGYKVEETRQRVGQRRPDTEDHMSYALIHVTCPEKAGLVRPDVDGQIYGRSSSCTLKMVTRNE